jgi:molybdopterin-guanine dinucleotide biosynthesis protein A
LAFLPLAAASLTEGKNKIDTLFSRVELQMLEEDQLVQGGFSAAMFRNLNYPAEWEVAKAELEQP